MQVEQQHRASSSAWDIADILHPELFTAPANPNPNPSSSYFSSPSSRESTPMSQHLPTPPQQSPYPVFPSSSATASNPMDLSSESFFSFLNAADPEGKGAASSSDSATHQTTSTDPFAANGSNSFDYSFAFDYASLPMMMTSPMPAGGSQSAAEYGMDMNAFMGSLGMDSMDMGIDPQLVDSPAPLVTMGEDEDQAEAEEDVEEEEKDVDEPPVVSTRSSNKKRDATTESIASTRGKRGRAPKTTISTNTTASCASPSSPTATSPSTLQQEVRQPDKLTLTIAPVKVGGRGGTRRGTVQSGGITKKSAVPVNGSNIAIYSGSVLKVVKEDAGKENKATAAAGSKGRVRGRRGTTASAAPAALPSPPSSHHDGEDVEEDMSTGPTPGHRSNTSISSTSGASMATDATTSLTTSPATGNTTGGTILTGNALVAHGRKVTPFDLGIDGLSISASFAIPPGTFNVTTPSAVGSSSGLGVPALVAANAAASGTSGSTPTSASRYTTPALNFSSGGAVSNRAREREQSVDPDGDDLPADWRPSPEMLAKMTSKEKRQLRNKISARNFRVRRKEYISTLELDIAERDRLLDAIRSELGTSRSENSALRQEIAALKKSMLEGRGLPSDAAQNASAGYNLPPPAPLPEKSAAEVLMQQQQQQAAAAASSSSANLLKPNTQKDMHGNGLSAFWGGSASGGGFVPVHTAFVPSVASGFASMGGPYGTAGVGVGVGAPTKPKLQENMNPLLRASSKVNQVGDISERDRDAEKKDLAKDFEGFADMNMFTMKSMDAYRMHLWGKMAAQYHWHQKQQQALHQHPSPSPAQQQQQQQQISGLAAGLRPSYFTGVSAGVLSGKERSSSSSVLGNVTNTHPSSPKSEVYTPLLAALLHGKHGHGSKSDPSSNIGGHGDVVKEKKQAQFQAEAESKQRQQEQARAAVIAAVASQTMFRKLGQAFWDAFSGSSSSLPLSASSHQSKDWDADKVRRVLEGKAVVRVVDVDAPEAKVQPAKEVRRNVYGNNGGSLSMPSSPLMKATGPEESKCGGKFVDLLEERMRSLALGPRAGKD